MAQIRPFTPLTEGEFYSLFTRGGALGDIEYYVPLGRRRGGNLFNVLKNYIFPWIKAPLLKLGSAVLDDVSQGKRFTSSLKTRSLETARDALRGRAGASAISRRSRKKKRPCKYKYGVL